MADVLWQWVATFNETAPHPPRAFNPAIWVQRQGFGPGFYRAGLVYQQTGHQTIKETCQLIHECTQKGFYRCCGVHVCVIITPLIRPTNPGKRECIFIVCLDISPLVWQVVLAFGFRGAKPHECTTMAQQFVLS